MNIVRRACLPLLRRGNQILPKCTALTAANYHPQTIIPRAAFTSSTSKFSSAKETNLIKTLPAFDVQDKVIIISGGARGLGFAQARGLISAGAIVHAIDALPTPSPEFQALQSEDPQRLHYHNLDVRDEALLHSTVQKVAETHNRLDGHIAAAGILEEIDAFDYTAADFRKILDVNITGVFLTSQACAKQMARLKAGGSIVLIASMSGTISNKGLRMTAYNTSKGGVKQMGRNLATEWAEHGIRVNTLSPGYITTQMVEQLFQTYPERRAEWSSQNMLNRLSRPEEFTGAAIFLLSDASSYMTAADLVIDGGHMSW